MFKRPITIILPSSRNVHGAQISEFSVSLVLLVWIIIALINLSIIPLRWGLVASLLANRVHQLSLVQNLSTAFSIVDDGTTLNNDISRVGGVHIKSSYLTLGITSMKFPDQTVTLDCPGKIRPEWLPDGAKSPCEYFLTLRVETYIDPFLTTSFLGWKIPGLNGPIPMTIQETSHWENLGRDPVTTIFFVNQ